MSAYQCSAPLYVQVVSSESEDDSDESEPSDDDDDVYELDAPSPAIAPKVRTNEHQASCSLQGCSLHVVKQAALHSLAPKEGTSMYIQCTC